MRGEARFQGLPPVHADSVRGRPCRKVAIKHMRKEGILSHVLLWPASLAVRCGLALFFLFRAILGWGREGHAIVAFIAERYVPPVGPEVVHRGHMAQQFSRDGLNLSEQTTF